MFNCSQIVRRWHAILFYLLLGRLLRIDLTKPVSNVRPSVHKNFLRF